MDEFACACLKSTRYFIQMRLNKNVSTEVFYNGRSSKRGRCETKERHYYYSHDPMVSLFLLT